MSNAAPKPAKQAAKALKNPLKAARDVSGYTEMKKQQEAQQQKADAAAAAAEERNVAAEKGISGAEEKKRQAALEAARGRSAGRRARGGARGYRSLLAPAGDDTGTSLSGR